MMSGGESRARPSLICDRLPDTITVAGETYAVSTDFRRWILLVELFEEEVDGTPAADCAAMLVCEDIRPILHSDPTLATEFLREIGRFALCGEVRGEIGENFEKRAERPSRSTPVFDFEIDSERIFASFMAVYGIDLSAVNMHWWKFMALLRCLPRDCALMQVVDLRSIDITQIADDKLRKTLRRAKNKVSLRSAKCKMQSAKLTEITDS